MKREPSAIIGLITAILSLLVLRGILGLEEAGAWSAIAMAAVPLLQGLVTRFFVWSPRSVEAVRDQAFEFADATRPPDR